MLLVVLAGAFLPVQAGLNTRVGRVLSSPIWATFISFCVGGLALLAYILISKQPVNLEAVKNVPIYGWLAGVLGAAYVAIVVMAFPKLGPALSFGLIVLGQMIISLLLDHFKILVLNQQSINIYRLIGVALIVFGVVLIRKY